ncbi:hypothetical protein [Pseudobdellovibrio sp. HCB154]|uniref:hypothetical protein n=1 Tax=Pseudobdellovibrio sp. HCB154 TaxID=3386277 RepID=UPI003916F10D
MSKKTDIMNDPFDEFEFKPLTSGLGFHKESTSTKASTPSVTSKVEFKSSHLTFDTPATTAASTSVNTTTPAGFNLNSPLPRTATQTTTTTNTQRKASINVPTIEDDSISKAQTAVNEILKNLNQKKQQEEALARNTRRPEWIAAVPSVSAGFLDTMLIAAFFLLSLIAMLAITKIDLIANISNPDPQYLIYWATLSLLGGIQIIYYVACRAFLGCTPGEWAFDQRCGNELQQASSTYVLRVAARSVINVATGFVLMTLISLVLRFDVLAAVTGTQIQKQKT